MSSQISSEVDTLQPCPNVSIQQIFKQNKMKDLALTKATNLIQLLNLQLQVQRNSHKESLRYLQEDLKQHYESLIQQLKDKITFLQHQRNNGTISFSNEKTIRPSVFNRANSVKSMNHKKKTINKKYTQTFTKNEDSSDKKEQNAFSNYFRYEMMELAQWRSSVTAQLNQLIKSQYDQLTTFIGNIQGTTDQYDQLISKKSDKKQNLFEQISHLVKSQNKLINSFHAYTKQLDDMYKSSIFQLNSLFSNKWHESKTQIVELESARLQILKLIANKKRNWQDQLQQLNNQNIQLKTITESMIKLIQQQKKIRF